MEINTGNSENNTGNSENTVIYTQLPSVYIDINKCIFSIICIISSYWQSKTYPKLGLTSENSYLFALPDKILIQSKGGKTK